MPELPEVETSRRTLEPLVAGRRIVGLRVGDFPGVLGGDDPAAVEARLAGSTIERVRRRGKYLLLELDDGTTIEAHLRMTGQLVVVPAGTSPLRFEHLAIALDDGQEIRFADQRKFGRVRHLPEGAADRLEARLGPEPLSAGFTAAALAAAVARRPGKIKSVLLDQRLVAGLGNIYVDEALFLARIHPERAANSLTEAETRRLHRVIRAVLRAGIARRGTSFSSYRDARGASGENQRFLNVYGRARGGRCPRCGGEIARIVVGGRGTHFCPVCQR
ncbi:MAG TPA: DNA-formamidopyrimidine glycosylase [Thermomicrobiales bacterium]|nr:DNA-formamidopyrimidine glycosylase [Thermomicrobiales bacterium]